MSELVSVFIGSTVLTSIVNYYLFKKKHAADVKAAEKVIDRSEIENYQFIAKEWREAAQKWKDLADEYQTKLTEGSKKYVELSANYLELKKELSVVKGKLTKAYKRIEELERHDDNK